MVSAIERLEKIEVASACQLVAEAIEREIVAGRMRPGDGVGTEAALCNQFGVNRSTVREAIRVLEQSGLVQRGTDRRLYASLPRYSGLSSRVSRALILHEVTFRELCTTARVLEMASAEQAAEQRQCGSDRRAGMQSGGGGAGGRRPRAAVGDRFRIPQAAGKGYPQPRARAGARARRSVVLSDYRIDLPTGAGRRRTHGRGASPHHRCGQGARCESGEPVDEPARRRLAEGFRTGGTRSRRAGRARLRTQRIEAALLEMTKPKTPKARGRKREGKRDGDGWRQGFAADPGG